MLTVVCMKSSGYNLIPLMSRCLKINRKGKIEVSKKGQKIMQRVQNEVL
jgi:hypothetical protein